MGRLTDGPEPTPSEPGRPGSEGPPDPAAPGPAGPDPAPALDPTGRPVPPEPADPRDLPEPVEPAEHGGRAAVVTPAMAQEITTTRLVAAARRPLVWVSEVLYAAVLLGIGVAVGSRWWSPLAWLAGGVLIALWIVSRASRKALQALYPPKTEVRVATGTDGLRFTAPKGSYLLPWSEVRSAEVVREHLVLRRTGPGGAIILPPPLFGPDTVEAATAAADRHQGTHPDA